MLRVIFQGRGGAARRPIARALSSRSADADPLRTLDPFPRDAPQPYRVVNQATPLSGHNWAARDPAILEPVTASAPWHVSALTDYSERICSPEREELTRACNESGPVLKTHDRRGRRVDVAEYHPSYHSVKADSIGAGQHSIAWERGDPDAFRASGARGFVPRGYGTGAAKPSPPSEPPSPDLDAVTECLIVEAAEGRGAGDGVGGRHVARGATELMGYAMESGHTCPVVMTFAVVPCLVAHAPEIAREWVPKLISREYDGERVAAPLAQKRGAIAGMSLTELASGSDVRTNETFAARDGPLGHRLLGHKWFTSAPNSDGFLTLAVTEKGAPPSCFMVPRCLPDGSRNPFLLQRLKSKVGDRSNASSEVNYNGTHAQLIGAEGRGVPVIIEMVNHTRLSCALGSAGLMRRAALEAVHHTRRRGAFGKLLVDQPLMRSVLADLCLESEAAVAVALRLCAAYDESPGGGAFGRIATAVTKYYVCKRTVQHVYEAMECHGGNGYVEDFPIARLYRQAPLNSIWEGSGNVIALDILRAMAKEPAAVPALMEELGSVRGADPALDALVDEVAALLASPAQELEARARRLADILGVALQATALLQRGDKDVAAAFIATRVREPHARNYGSAIFDPAMEKVLIERASVAHL